MAELLTGRLLVASLRAAAIVLSIIVVLMWLRGGQSYAQCNIVRSQYDEALARWNSLKVIDYEAIIGQTSRGQLKIVVNVDNAYGLKVAPRAQATYAHRIVSFESLDCESARPARYDIEDETIGGLFDRVAGILDCQEHPYLCEQDRHYLPTRYHIQFDETLGYPRSITSINRFAILETTVEDVKILR
jgi:hypothetical protein